MNDSLFIQDSNKIICFNKKELKYLKLKLLQRHDFQTKKYIFRALQGVCFCGFSVWTKIEIDNFVLASSLAINHITIDQISELIRKIDIIMGHINLIEIEI